MNIVIEAFIIAVGLNLFLFLPAYYFQSDKLTDFSYSLTFIILAVLGYSRSYQSRIDLLVLVLIILWSLRLGGFLFIRILKQGKDSRFDEMRKKWFSFFRFWLFQGLTVFLVILPALLVWQKHGSSNLLVYIGLFIWATGLIIETIADHQKYSFKLRGGKDWIDQGLWRASRHPNYLGEITVWIGLYLVCVSSLLGINKIIALISPLYITLILVSFSGMPLLEKSADKKWGNNKNYQRYKKDVPVLIPNLFSNPSCLSQPKGK